MGRAASHELRTPDVPEWPPYPPDWEWPVKIELGSPVVLVEGIDALWHLPQVDELGPVTRPGGGFGEELTQTRCGLWGASFVYQGIVRDRRVCTVCRNQIWKRRGGRARTGAAA